MSFMQTIGSRIVLEGLGKYLGDLDKAERGTKGFGSAVEGASSRAGHAFGGMTKAVGLGALGAAGAIGGIGLASIKLAADFETTMSRIAGLTSTPESAIAGLREQILKLSTEVAISPNELGAGAYFILSSGITDVATAMKVLELSSKAAVAGLGETKVIASTVTSIMNAYGFSIDEAERATNALVNTVKLGKGEPAELAQALGFVIPFASQLGVEIEEVGGIIATLTNIGLGAENAVTALKNVFVSLLTPTDLQREAFARLGLSVEVFRQRVEEDAGAALTDLVKRASTGSEALSGLGLTIDQLSELTKRSIDRIRSKPKEVASAFDELSVATGLTKNAMAELLGLPLEALNNLNADDAIKSIVTLQSSLSGADGVLAELFPDIRSLTGVLGAFGVQGEATTANIQAMKDGTNALDVAFKAAEETAAFKFKRALVSVQTAMIQLGAVALPVVAKVTEGVAKLVGVFIKLPGPIKKIVVIGGVLGAAFLAAAGAALILAPGIVALIPLLFGTGAAGGAAAGGVTALNVALLPLLIVPLAIAAALVGLVAVAILLEKKFGTLSSVFKAVKGFLTGMVAGFKDADTGTAGFHARATGLIGVGIEVGRVLGNIAQILKTVLNRALVQTTQLWAGLQPALGTAGAALVAIGKIALEVAGFLKEHPILLGAIAVALGVVLAPLIATAVAFAALPLAIAAVVAAGVLFLAFWDDIRRVASNALDVFRDLPARLGDLGPLILSGLEVLPGLVGKAAELIGQAIIDGIVAGARAAWAVHEFIPEIPGLIVGLIGDLGGLLIGAGGQAIGGLLKGAEAAAPALIGFFKSLPKLWVTGIKRGLGRLVTIGSTALGLIADGLSAAFPVVVSVMSNLPGLILGALISLPGLLITMGAALIRGFVTGVKAAWKGADDFFYGLPGWILGAIGDLATLLWDKGPELLTGLWNGWVDFRDNKLYPFLAKLPGEILDAIGDLAGTLFDSGIKLLTGLWNGWVDYRDNTLYPFLRRLPGEIVTAIGDVSRTLYQSGDDILSGLFDGVNFVYETGKTFFSNLPGNLLSLLGDVSSVLYNAGAAIVQGLFNGIKAVLGGAGSLFAGLKGSFNAAINAIIDQANSLLRGVNSLDVFGVVPDIPLIGRVGTQGGVVPENVGGIGQYQHGTRSFPGGLAIVGEAGPELAALPRGSRIWPHGESMRILEGLTGRLPGFQGGLGLDTAFSGLSSILALVQKLLAKIPTALFNSNLNIPSFEHGGYVPAGQQMLAQLHGPEAIVPMRGAMTASAPGLVVNISAPVSVTINEMNWARVRSVALAALDEALGSARSTAIRQGAPLSSGIS